MIRVLFVCLGNICRSPTAEAVFRAYLKKHDLEAHIQADSAGTASWHEGKSPDERSIAKGAERGYDLSRLRARQVIEDDFNQFDYILAMDKQNLANLQTLKPEGSSTEPTLFLDYAGLSQAEVPDPYYGGEDGFDEVVDLVEKACEGLIKELKKRL